MYRSKYKRRAFKRRTKYNKRRGKSLRIYRVSRGGIRL